MNAVALRARTILDLGEMKDIAEVRVNGKSAGVLWYPPYRADITELLVAGENDLEILVTNNWVNRLIGDEQEPADFESVETSRVGWAGTIGDRVGNEIIYEKNAAKPGSKMLPKQEVKRCQIGKFVL